MSRRPARYTQADLTRAIRAAAKVGPNVAVDILPDGTIRLHTVPQKVGFEGEPPIGEPPRVMF